jgi:hypothetical protein
MAFTSGIRVMSSTAAIASTHYQPPATQGHVDTLLIFGIASAIATLVCYLHRHRGSFAMLTFTISLLATAIYACEEGAWPVGMLEAMWAFTAANRVIHSNAFKRPVSSRSRAFVADLSERQSRYRETFGSN